MPVNQGFFEIINHFLLKTLDYMRRKKQDKTGSNTGLVKFVEIWKRYGKIVMLSSLLSFILSVLAGVVAYYICKWLDGEE